MQNGPSRSPPTWQKEIARQVADLGYRHSHWQVFADFVEMAAIAISNAVDLPARAAREKRYMEVVGRYKPDEAAKFLHMFGMLTMALEIEMADVLGRTFHDLELHNRWSGQFFSPYPICRMIAKMIVGNREELEGRIAKRGYLTASEPCCGSGAMVIALAHEIRELGFNYQKHLHVTAVDVDPKCVHMTYLQLSLLHVPAIVIHGNSLRLEEFGHWYTPAHIMGGWNWKLRRRVERNDEQPISQIEEAPPRPDDTRKQEPPSSQLTLF